MRHVSPIFIATLLISGCLSHDEARIPGGTYRLQPPADGPWLNGWSVVTSVTDTESLDFILQIKNDGVRLEYALLEPVGMVTLLAGSFDGANVECSGPLARSIPSALPLAAIQMIHWPSRSFSTGLDGAIEFSEDSRGRRLNRGREALFTVTHGDVTVVRATMPPLTLRIGKAQTQ